MPSAPRVGKNGEVSLPSTQGAGKGKIDRLQVKTKVVTLSLNVPRRISPRI